MMFMRKDDQDEFETDSEYEFFEDPEFVIGNEVCDEDDDALYESNVDSTNIDGDAYFVECPIESLGTQSLGFDSSNIDKGGPSKADKGKKKVMVESSEEEVDSEKENDMVGSRGEDFDESRLSESDEGGEGPNYPIFNPKTIFSPDFSIEQVFASKKEFKKSVDSYAIKVRRAICFTKNDERRVYARCRNKKCKWMINLLKMKDENSWQIRKYFEKHKCPATQKVKNLTSRWLSERFIQRFQSDKKRSVIGFMDDVNSDMKVTISRGQAYRAKVKALEMIEGDPDAQYSKLWSYAEQLRKTNPGSTIILGTELDEGVTRFNKFYVYFDALKKGFLAVCRPLLGVDGCWLKSKHGGILLTAVGVDGNNNLFPVAYAVVEKENGEISEWFLTVLKQDLQINNQKFTFISDKQKGLIQAFQKVFPGSAHRFCVRHMHNNLKIAGFRGLAYKQVMWKAACSTNVGEFNDKMREMKGLNEACWEWFHDKPPEQWSKAFFSCNSKCDMLLNNVCESFNAAILDARDKAIITMMEWVREYLMKRLQKNRDKASGKWKGKLCPRINKIIELNMERISDCIPLKASDRHYQVRCFYGGQYVVDLELKECTCRSWQLTGIPCTHALCAILNQKLEPEDMVHQYYHVSTYLQSYEHAILPISYETLCGDTFFIPPLPPDFGKKAKRGRKATNRRLEPGEKEQKTKKTGKGVKLQKMRRQQKAITCRKCGEQGHNTGSCTIQVCLEPENVVDNARGVGGDGNVVGTGAPNTTKTNMRGYKRQRPDNSAGGIAPPRFAYHGLIDEPGEVQQPINTQESSVTASSWLHPLVQPMMQGPTMFQQLQMGQPQSRVQFRAPPPFGQGSFSYGPPKNVKK